MKSVLIVEDTPDLQEVIAFAVREAGYDPIAVGHGRQALELLQGLPHPPCLVLLDMIMPEMDGWDFLQALQGSRRLIELPIVAITGIADDRPLQGVRRTLKKPIGLQTLLRVLEDFCGPPDDVHDPIA